VKDGITGKKWPVNLASDFDFHVNHRFLYHAAKLRNGADGLTFLSEGRQAVAWGTECATAIVKIFKTNHLTTEHFINSKLGHTAVLSTVFNLSFCVCVLTN
jgi:hypothetical protein